MKRTILALAFCATIAASEEIKPLPSEIALKNNAKVRRIENVVRWEKDRVVVKHAGGTDPVLFANMAPESRAIWEERGKIALREQKKLEELQGLAAAERQDKEQQSRVDAEKWRGQVTQAVANHKLLTGMTPAEAIASWGRPGKRNVDSGSAGNHEQWVYIEGPAIIPPVKRGYIYFDDGRLSSWSKSE